MGFAIDVAEGLASELVPLFFVDAGLVRSTTALEPLLFDANSRLFFVDRSVPQASHVRYEAGLCSVQISQAQTSSTSGPLGGDSGFVAVGTGGGFTPDTVDR